MSFSIGIVIPTYQGASHLPHLLPILIKTGYPILVIDSSSTDETVEIAQSFGVQTVTIPKEEFRHGSTREWGRKQLKTSIVVMMTQDAYPSSPSFIDHLTQPLLQKRASLAYARQLPHRGAGLIESFHRNFNYPEISQLRGMEDLPTYGTFTFFCSNSCAAYLNSALDEIGGFPSVSFGEDTAAAARMLDQGHKVAYVAEAVVYHSHAYSLKQEFKRHLEIGASRYFVESFLKSGEKDEHRGKIYAYAMLKFLFKKNPLKIPYALLHLFVKWLGYKIGKNYTKKYGFYAH